MGTLCCNDLLQVAPEGFASLCDAVLRQGVPGQPLEMIQAPNFWTREPQAVLSKIKKGSLEPRVEPFRQRIVKYHYKTPK